MIQKVIEKINRLSRREKTIFAVTAGIVGLLLVDRLIIAPALSYLRKTEEKIELRRMEYIRNQRNLALKPQIVPLYQEIVSQTELQGTEDQQISDTLREIEKLGSESEVPLSNIKPKAAKPLELYKILAVDVEAECSIKKFMNLIYNLQNSKQGFRVEVFKMRMNEKDPEMMKVSMTVSRLVLEKNPLPVRQTKGGQRGPASPPSSPPGVETAPAS